MKSTTVPKPDHSQLPACPLVVVGFQRIELDDLVSHPENVRAFDAKDPDDIELMRSMLELGQSTPGICRMAGTKYQVLAGHRRLGAAAQAMKENIERASFMKLYELEMKVVECDDERAFRLVILENLQRKNPSWREEAKGVARLLAHGMTAEQVAGELGKSPSWVAKRAKLSTIHQKWIDAATSDEDFQHWSVGMLELIARHSHAQQLEMLDDWEIKNSDDAQDLERRIEKKYTRALKSAPWDLADAKLLPKAGACNTCSFRSSCQTNLFEANKAGDTCTNKPCWDAKTEALTELRKAELRKEHKNLIVMVDVDRHDDRHLKKDEVPAGDMKRVKEGTAGARPALNASTGQMAWVKPEGYVGDNTRKIFGLKAYGEVSAGPAQKASKGSGEKRVTPPKVRLEIFMKRREKAAVGIVIEKLGGHRDATSPNHWGHPKACTKDVVRPSRLVLVAFAAAYGIHGMQGCGGTWSRFVSNRDMGDENLDVALWLEVRRTVISRLISDKQFRSSSTGAEIVAEACSIDWKAVCAEVQDKMPLPKTLAAEFEEDGTKRAGVAAVVHRVKLKKAKA